MNRLSGADRTRVVAAEKKSEGCGDVWTWVAIDPDTKLIPAWHIGDRTAQSAYHRMLQVSRRWTRRLQLSTDGHRAYLIAVEAAFSFCPVDFAQVVKIYGNVDGWGHYSPSDFMSETTTVISGNPDLALASTSHVERQNLTMRMRMRRFTRLTNAFCSHFHPPNTSDWSNTTRGTQPPCATSHLPRRQSLKIVTHRR